MGHFENLTKPVSIDLNAKNGVGMTLFCNNYISGQHKVVNLLGSRFARSSSNLKKIESILNNCDNN